MSDERIEWEEIHHETVWLMVDMMHHRRIATRDDLLRACEAAGLRVCDGSERRLQMMAEAERDDWMRAGVKHQNAYENEHRRATLLQERVGHLERDDWRTGHPALLRQLDTQHARIAELERECDKARMERDVVVRECEEWKQRALSAEDERDEARAIARSVASFRASVGPGCSAQLDADHTTIASWPEVTT